MDTFPILLAEDNEHDIVAVKRIWKQHNLLNQLCIVRDGQECMDYLLREGSYAPPANAPRPGLLLLDLNMPKMGGLEVLRQVREIKDLQQLPVVVLATSKRDEDRIENYDLGVDAYVMKPVQFEKFAEAVRKIPPFGQLVELPD